MSQNQLDSRLVGRVLARLRAEKGITQEVLSGLSDIGRTHLSALERGERKRHWKLCIASAIRWICP